VGGEETLELAASYGPGMNDARAVVGDFDEGAAAGAQVDDEPDDGADFM